MAGLGKKTFTAGEVLTAADVNGFLMEQSVMVFGGTAARSSAIPTPSEGMVTYQTDTNQIDAYNGSAWVGMGGLQLIKTQTVGSGVTSVSVTNAFNADFDNYKIIYSGGTLGTGTTTIRFALNGITTGYYSSLTYQVFGTAGLQAGVSNNADRFSWAGGASTNGTLINLEIQNPFATKYKTGSAVLNEPSTTGAAGTTQYFLNSNASATGFTIDVASSSLTGGTIAVYGYAKG